jgi:hypothetical protein
MESKINKYPPSCEEKIKGSQLKASTGKRKMLARPCLKEQASHVGTCQ